MTYSKSIPFDSISRLEIVPNTGKLTISKFFPGQHCAACLDGPFYNYGTRRATVPMRIHGVDVFDTLKLRKNPWSDYVIAWNDGEAPQMCLWPCRDKENAFTNTVLVIDGKKRAKPIWHSDADGTPQKPRYTSRVGYGIKDGRLMLYASTAGISLPGMQSIEQSAGWDFGIMGDGGASTCWMDDHGGKIYTSRPVAYYVCVWVLPEGVERKMITGFGPVNVFSVRKHGAAYLTKNFQVKEFAQKSIDTVFISPTTPNILQDVRAWAGASVKILSGYRNDEHNAEVDGAVYSQHKYGHAADIATTGKTPKQVYDYLCKRYPGKYGFGLYSWGVHVDDRATAARWKG